MKRAIAVAALLVAGCGQGTFVVLDFPSGPAGTTSIHAALTLGGQAAEATFDDDGSALVFPTSSSIEIGSGAGPLAVTATARDAAGKPLAVAMASVTVARDETVRLSLALADTGPREDLGQSGSAALAIAPLARDFGAAVVDTEGATHTFTVTNTGTAVTTALSISLLGADVADFAIVQPADCVGRALAPGASCTVDARFAPTSAGATKTATLRVGTTTESASATLTGFAGTAGALVWNDTDHAFPETLVGDQDGDVTFTLRNGGTTASSTVTIALGGTDAGELELFDDACGGTVLAGGATCTVKVRSRPTRRGAATATLRADADAGGLAVITLHGEGIIPGVLTLVGAAPSSAPFDFGTVDVGDTSTTMHTFTVRNDGDQPTGELQLALTPATTTLVRGGTCNPAGGGGAAPFTTLDAGESCTITLAFAPTTYGRVDTEVALSASPGGSASTHVTGLGRLRVTVTYARTDVDLNAAPGFNGDGHLGAFASSNGYACPFGPCATTSELVDAGTVLTVTASAATWAGHGSSLRRVTGPCTAQAVGTAAAQCSFTVTGAVTVEALYSAHNFAFVTANGYLGDLGGLTGADALCQAEADAAHLPGSFVAYLSSSTVDARTRLGLADGWLRSDLRPVAASSTALHDAHAVLYPLSLDAGGNNRTGSTRTATDQNGLRRLLSGAAPCDDWTSSITASFIVLGAAGFSAPGWVDANEAQNCDVGVNLYCFGTNLATPIAPLPIGGARRAFVTSATFVPGPGGIATADSLCASAQAVNPTLAGRSFRAFMTGDPLVGDGSMAGRFSPVGAPWARLDGVLLAPTAASLLSSSVTALASLDLTADGTTYLATNGLAWLGAATPADAAQPANDCTAWTQTTGTGLTGAPSHGPAGVWNHGRLSCTDAYHVYCLEQ